MKTQISDTEFGSITAGAVTYEHDILIRLDGSVEKRKKKLSRQVFGTAHIISLAEAEYIYEQGARVLVIGSGQSGMLKLSPEAQAFLEKKGCRIELLPTPKAIRCWNELEKPAIGLFHITC